jgi:hypothetical protein
MSEIIRSLLRNSSPAQSSDFDRESFQRAMYAKASREPEPAEPGTDYEEMRSQHRIQENSPPGGQHFLYHPEGQLKRAVTPSMMRGHLKDYGHYYLNQEPAAE